MTNRVRKSSLLKKDGSDSSKILTRLFFINTQLNLREMPKDLNDNDFLKKLKNADQKMIVDFLIKR